MLAWHSTNVPPPHSSHIQSAHLAENVFSDSLLQFKDGEVPGGHILQDISGTGQGVLLKRVVAVRSLWRQTVHMRTSFICICMYIKALHHTLYLNTVTHFSC